MHVARAEVCMCVCIHYQIWFFFWLAELLCYISVLIVDINLEAPLLSYPIFCGIVLVIAYLRLKVFKGAVLYLHICIRTVIRIISARYKSVIKSIKVHVFKLYTVDF